MKCEFCDKRNPGVSDCPDCGGENVMCDYCRIKVTCPKDCKYRCQFCIEGCQMCGTPLCSKHIFWKNDEGFCSDCYNESEPSKYKVVVVGEGGVGKSALRIELRKD